MRGLNWQTMPMPLAVGLNQKADARALQPPSLEVCKDVQFDELGGLQTRKPFAADDPSVFGGGALTNTRHIVENGDELLCFTRDTLYSWSPTLEKWISKGTHLAVKVDHAPRFVTTGDNVACDRAELDGTIVYTWNDDVTGYVAAVDKESGAVIMAPTALSGSTYRLRVIALDSVIMLTYFSGVGGAPGGFYCYALNPASPATAIAGSATTIYDTGSAANLYYDVTRIPNADSIVLVGRLTPTTSYLIAKVTSALSVSTSVKARTCTGAIAVSCTPDGASAQVIRGNAGNVQGDLITISSLADVYTAQAVGTVSNTGPGTGARHIAAAHRSVTDSGVYRCYAFWSSVEGSTGAPDGGIRSNWVSSGNTLGTEAVFGASSADVYQGVASRAFDHNGRVFFWSSFAGISTQSTGSARAAVQNAYFLFRDDAFLVAKAVASLAGGRHGLDGHLPGVALVSGSTGYAWCGTKRRAVPVGVGTGGQAYSARAPEDVLFTFDSNEARRCERVGKTLYITGGEILQYDGQRLTEVGFHVFPWLMTLSADTGTGSLADGEYAYKSTDRWENAQGELDRSSTATVAQQTMSGGPGHMTIALTGLTATHKYITGNLPAHEVWRTVASPVDDSPFYLVTAKDPSTTGANGYATVATTSFDDAFDDATLTTKETNPENAGVLENLAPPAATIIAATEDRIFLAGIAGDPDRVWYSKQRGDGEVVAFNDALTINVPHDGGAITAVAFLNETLVVFRETAIYAFPGQGFDNIGGGQNYGPATKIPGDCGALNAESVVVTPDGLLFQSSKGFYLLSAGWSTKYIGAPVADYESETVVAAHLIESQHQVRILSEARMLVLDYLVDQWSEWSIPNAASAAIWQGNHVYLDADTDSIMAQQSTFSNVDYGWDVETAWIPMAALQGAGRVRWFEVLGEYRSTFHLRVRVAYDYKYASEDVPLWVDDEYWTPSPTTVGSVLQVRHHPEAGRCQAIKIRLTAVSASNHAVAPSGEAAKLTGLALELGFDRGLFRTGLTAAQKQ